MTNVPEYKSEARVKASQMRQLDGIDIMILKVYKHYRYGWDEVAKKFRTFEYFPSRLQESVIYS